MKLGRIILWIATAGFLLLLAGSVLVYQSVSHSREDLERTVAELQSCGESFSVSDMTPQPVMSEAAQRFFEATHQLSQEDKKMIDSLAPFVGWREPFPGQVIPIFQLQSVRDGEDTSWANLEVSLRPLQPVIEELLAASESGPLEAQPDYAHGYRLTMDEQFILLSSARVLGASALVDMHSARPAEAARKITAILRIADMVSHQQLLISQLMTCSFITIAHHLTWHFLAMPDQQEPLLAALQREWQSLQISQSFTTALRVERAMGLEFVRAQMDGPAPSLRSWKSSLPSSYAELHMTVNVIFWKTFFRYGDTKDFILRYQSLIDAVPVADFTESWNDYLEASREIAGDSRIWSSSRWMSRVMTPVLQGLGDRLAMAETLRALTVTSIAIRRYQLQHEGQLPASLEDLVPDWIPAIPADPFGDDPLVYRQDEPGVFTLYSVGLDGVDHGGDATPLPAGKRTSRPPDRRDMVWPRVATPAVPVFSPQ